MIDYLKHNRQLSIPLVISLLFFLRKGVQYALIGSYIPLLVILVVLGIFAKAILSNPRGLIYMSRIWAAILSLWSIMRILFSVVHLTVKPFNEQNLHQQFGFGGLLLSLVVFILAIMIFRNARLKHVRDFMGVKHE